MSEEHPHLPVTPEPVPIEVRPTPAWAMFGVLLRQIALIGGALTTLFTLVSSRDIRGIFDYIGDAEFMQMLLIIAGAASMIWGLVREWTIWKRLLTLQDYVDDQVAVVKSKLQSIKDRWFSG